MQRIWTEQLRTLAEELEQSEELGVRALKNLVVRGLLRNLAVRALLRNLAVRALRVKHLAYEQASLPWPSSACLHRPQ